MTAGNDVALLAAAPDQGPLSELIIEAAYLAVLVPGDDAIDGGANNGRHLVPMARAVGASGRVLGVEPIPALADRLERKLAAEGLTQARLVRAALAASAGRAAFNVVTNDPAYSGLQLRDYPFDARIERIEVQTIAIDDIAGDLNRLAFVKLDLEGGEFRALQGGRETLRRRRPLVTFENGLSKPAKSYGYDRNEFFNFFASLGYALHDIFGRPFVLTDWERPGLPWNFFAVPRERTDFVAATLPGALARLAAARHGPESGGSAGARPA